VTSALDALSRGARRVLGRPLEAGEVELFSKYLDLLAKWQKTHRLVGSDDPRWIVQELILPSLLFRDLLPADARNVLDLGSGAGFPGLPLKIVGAVDRITLVEARRRRASFLATAVRTLGLTNVTVIGERLLAAPAALAGQFDAVVMRCAGGLVDVLPLALEFVRPGGVVVASGPPSPESVPGVRWIETGGRNFGLATR
jgi:16S rRNA (guanine527-N7)-methyltransferase